MRDSCRDRRHIEVSSKGKTRVICGTCAKTAAIWGQGYKRTYIQTWTLTVKVHYGGCSTHCNKIFEEDEKQKVSFFGKRIGKNRAIVAIARILLEKIFIVLKKGEEFVDNIDTLTERKIRTMEQRAKEAKRAMRNIDIQKTTKSIKGNVISDSAKELFS